MESWSDSFGAICEFERKTFPTAIYQLLRTQGGQRDGCGADHTENSGVEKMLFSYAMCGIQA
jgi:hypothetical protein